MSLQDHIKIFPHEHLSPAHNTFSVLDVEGSEKPQFWPVYYLKETVIPKGYSYNGVMCYLFNSVGVAKKPEIRLYGEKSTDCINIAHWTGGVVVIVYHKKNPNKYVNELIAKLVEAFSAIDGCQVLIEPDVEVLDYLKLETAVKEVMEEK